MKFNHPTKAAGCPQGVLPRSRVQVGGINAAAGLQCAAPAKFFGGYNG